MENVHACTMDLNRFSFGYNVKMVRWKLQIEIIHITSFLNCPYKYHYIYTAFPKKKLFNIYSCPCLSNMASTFADLNVLIYLE